MSLKDAPGFFISPGRLFRVKPKPECFMCSFKAQHTMNMYVLGANLNTVSETGLVILFFSVLSVTPDTELQKCLKTDEAMHFQGHRTYGFVSRKLAKVKRSSKHNHKLFEKCLKIKLQFMQQFIFTASTQHVGVSGC